MDVIVTDLSTEIMISVHLKRSSHDNGMTLQEYADAIMAGTHPILSHDEFVYHFGTEDDVIAVVTDFAAANNLEIAEACSTKSSVKLKGLADSFNRIFGITLHTVVDDDHIYHTYDGDLKMPDSINDVVEMIMGLDTSIRFKNHAIADVHDDTEVDLKISPSVYPTKATVTPVQVAKAYNLPPGDGYGGCVAILEMTYYNSPTDNYQTGYNASDVNSSFSRIGLTAPTIVNISVSGAVPLSVSDAESMLDIYCAGAVVPKATIAYYTGPNSGQGFLDCILAVAADNVNNPSALGISWGGTEGSYDYLASAFQACIAKGITCFVSAGDSGAANLVPDYPASSPYVISSGGTSIYLNADNSLNAETAWASTGGGISSIISKPSWQNGLNYTTYSTTAGASAPAALSMRGYPDVSAPSDSLTGYVFYVNSVLCRVGGTSAAAPFLAGMIVRLNVLLGKRIGYCNALFYANPGIFNDITQGDNALTQNGYITTAGWDAVTGLGSPNGPAMYRLLHTGTTYPKTNLGFRPAAGESFPRINDGSRHVTASYFIPFNSTTTSASATNAQLGSRTDYTGTANTNSGVSITWTIGSTSVSVIATGIPFHSYYNSAAANIPAIQNYSKSWTYRGGTNVAGTQVATGGGKIGLWLNGISMFNPSAAGGAPGGYTSFANWHYNAAYEAGTELGYSFGEDNAGAHAAPPNEYHYHDGSMIVSGAWTLGIGHTAGTYGNGGIAECSVIPYLRGGLRHPDGHSKIMGICADGYPVYGPYGYSTATNANSGTRRMTSGYTVNTVRTANGTTPPVNATYPLGMFVEDWSFTGGGDLDTHNGRYCVTPEYPNGTYAYFLAFNASMKPTYPYVIGNTYFGTPAVL